MVDEQEMQAVEEGLDDVGERLRALARDIGVTIRSTQDMGDTKAEVAEVTASLRDAINAEVSYRDLQQLDDEMRAAYREGRLDAALDAALAARIKLAHKAEEQRLLLEAFALLACDGLLQKRGGHLVLEQILDRAKLDHRRVPQTRMDQLLGALRDNMPGHNE